jgi:hypothetical protein
MVTAAVMPDTVPDLFGISLLGCSQECTAVANRIMDMMFTNLAMALIALAIVNINQWIVVHHSVSIRFSFAVRYFK